MYLFHPLFFSIQDFTPRDLNLIMTASGVGAPWLTQPLHSFWIPLTGPALSTTHPVHTDSILIEAPSAMALRLTIPGWWRKGISIPRPVKEAAVRLAGTFWGRSRPGGSPGGARELPCPWLRPPRKAEKPMKTACLTSLRCTGSTVRVVTMTSQFTQH